MTDHTDRGSYVADNVFPSGYAGHLQPALLSYIAATEGYLPPAPQGPHVYLELGCGNGVTLNALAASNPECQFIGIDFNPAHIAIAQEDADEAGLRNVRYVEGAFEQISIAELPDCDYIAIHGAYSWLPPAAVDAVHEIVRQKLRAGGLFYVDYLSAPHRVPISPLWFLLREATKDFEGESVDRVAHGMEILRRLNDVDGGYLARNPAAKRVLNTQLKRIDDGDPNVLRHLAHHALAEHQDTKYFVEIQNAMHGIGLEYAGSCDTWRNDPALCLPPDLQELYLGQNDPAVGELIKDFFLSETQRQDVFIKADASKRDAGAAIEYIRKNLFLFSMRPAAGIMTIWNRDIEAGKSRHRPNPVIELVLDCLDRGVWAFADIETHALASGFTIVQLIQALNVLVSRPDIHLCRETPKHPQAQAEPAGETTIPFNLAAEARSKRGGRAKIVLSSRVLGSGLVLGPVQALAFRAHLQGMHGGLGADSGPAEDQSLPTQNALRDFEARILPRLRKLGILG